MSVTASRSSSLRSIVIGFEARDEQDVVDEGREAARVLFYDC
jgi:hypothetical protein